MAPRRTEEEQERLAAALRANLARRKAQARQRQEGDLRQRQEGDLHQRQEGRAPERPGTDCGQPKALGNRLGPTRLPG